MANGLAQLAKQQFVLLETYRKSGVAVPTAVWFAEENGVLYIRTSAEAGKIKRIRNNPRVRVAPSDPRGKQRGPWVDAEARVLPDQEIPRVDRLLSRKYGWQKKLVDLVLRFKKPRFGMIAVQTPSDRAGRPS
jgi:uncharacterized protein